MSFHSTPIGKTFRVPGYDDLLLRLNATQVKCLGHGWLRKPVKLLRKGLVATWKAD